METRNIFIDASIFIGQNYNYKSTVFENIVRLAKASQAKVFLTDITIREIRAHIEKDVSKAIQASSKFKKDAKVLRNIKGTPFEEIFQEIDETKVIESLNNQLEEFLNEGNINILSISEVSIDAVFDRYFEKKPPFGDGKKKAEFPDAFTLEALESWCKKNDGRMYVVSTDQDLRDHCDASETLIMLSKLAEFISIVEFHDEILAPSVLSLVERKCESIADAISESFCDEGFWIDDQEGDVNEVRVNDIEIQEILILEVDHNSAVVHLDVKTNFSADLTYDDLETATYDSEDKVLIPWRKIDKTVEHDLEYTAIIHISHDVNNPDYLDIEEVDIDTEESYGFSISSDDEWPYK